MFAGELAAPTDQRLVPGDDVTLNDLQNRLCRILSLGLAEQARLAAINPQPLETIDNLAEALESVPSYIYNWRRLSTPALADAFRRHQMAHPNCPHDYRTVLQGASTPDWHFWNPRRIRDESVVGDDRLNPAQIYLLAVSQSLLRAIRSATWTEDAARLHSLGELAAALPDATVITSIDPIRALAGRNGPYAAAGCRHWMVFQPLTVAADEVPRHYLR